MGLIESLVNVDSYLGMQPYPAPASLVSPVTSPQLLQIVCSITGRIARIGRSLWPGLITISLTGEGASLFIALQLINPKTSNCLTLQGLKIIPLLN